MGWTKDLEIIAIIIGGMIFVIIGGMIEGVDAVAAVTAGEVAGIRAGAVVVVLEGMMRTTEGTRSRVPMIIGRALGLMRIIRRRIDRMNDRRRLLIMVSMVIISMAEAGMEIMGGLEYV